MQAHQDGQRNMAGSPSDTGLRASCKKIRSVCGLRTPHGGDAELAASATRIDSEPFWGRDNAKRAARCQQQQSHVGDVASCVALRIDWAARVSR